MEKVLNLSITLVLVLIGGVVAILGFDFLSQARPLEQTILIANLFLLATILLGSSLYFTITKFRSVSA